MLPSKNRLKKEKDIKIVFKEGQSIKEEPFLLKKTENGLEESRFCFIIPDNISKKATFRNKLKRKIREGVRGILPEIKKGLDVILIALPGAERKDFSELKKDILKAFLKANLFK